MLRRITTCIVTTCHSSIFGTTYQPIEFEGEGLGRRVVWRGAHYQSEPRAREAAVEHWQRVRGVFRPGVKK
ncbi:hypothetical protein SEA_VORRPS_21 [Mycobacterium phage Vorrps]|nr:hypothetical protein SEA_VORRPS_21 [Mycobacterium phage Vorrps]QXO13393.1 hypothetical protein SEA_MURAI_21 [Mycobacterium phage Murai]